MHCLIAPLAILENSNSILDVNTGDTNHEKNRQTKKGWHTSKPEQLPGEPIMHENSHDPSSIHEIRAGDPSLEFVQSFML
jgi:hypothetical protein